MDKVLQKVAEAARAELGELRARTARANKINKFPTSVSDDHVEGIARRAVRAELVAIEESAIAVTVAALRTPPGKGGS